MKIDPTKSRLAELFKALDFSQVPGVISDPIREWAVKLNKYVIGTNKVWKDEGKTNVELPDLKDPCNASLVSSRPLPQIRSNAAYVIMRQCRFHEYRAMFEVTGCHTSDAFRLSCGTGRCVHASLRMDAMRYVPFHKPELWCTPCTCEWQLDPVAFRKSRNACRSARRQSFSVSK